MAKYRKIILFSLIFLLVSTSFGSTIVTKLGRHSFLPSQLKNTNDLIRLVKDNEKFVKVGFNLAGQADLFDAFMKQLPNAQIEIVDFLDGSQFEWMLARKNGDKYIFIVKDVYWVSDSPFRGFAFNIYNDGYQYEFAVPLVCGNIALVGAIPTPVAYKSAVTPIIVRSDQSTESEIAVIYADSQPVSESAVAPIIVSSDPAAESVLQAGGSSAEPTGVSGITSVDAASRPISESADMGIVTPIDPSVESNYTIVESSESLVESRDIDAHPSSVGAAVGASVFNILADLGYYHQFDPTDYLFSRVGVEYKFSDKFSLLGLVGYAPKISSGDEGASAFIGHLFGEYNFSNFFFDLGIGGWITNGEKDLKTENTRTELVSAIGTRLIGDRDSFNISLFLEGRADIGDVFSYSDLSSFGRWGGGIRFKF